MKPIHDIVLIGAGNAATHIGRACVSRGIRVRYVFSRREESREKLASTVGARPLDDLASLGNIEPVDLILLSISDDAIREVASKIPKGDFIVAHTSGVTPIDAMGDHSERGIFYPVQSLQQEREINFREVPICLEASDEVTHDRLKQLADEIAGPTYDLNSEQRRWLHLAAVFANNFTNQLYGISDELLEKYGMPLEVLQPLIEETARRITEDKPAQLQTGPASRGDKESIEKHRKMLENHPDWLEVYDAITKMILKNR